MAKLNDVVKSIPRQHSDKIGASPDVVKATSRQNQLTAEKMAQTLTKRQMMNTGRRYFCKTQEGKCVKFYDFLLVWQDMTDLASNEGMVSFSRKLDAIHTLLQFWKEGKQVVLLMQLAMESLFQMKMNGIMIESLFRMKIRMNEFSSPAVISRSLACKVGELVHQFRQLPSVETVIIMMQIISRIRGWWSTVSIRRDKTSTMRVLS